MTLPQEVTPVILSMMAILMLVKDVIAPLIKRNGKNGNVSKCEPSAQCLAGFERAKDATKNLEAIKDEVHEIRKFQNPEIKRLLTELNSKTLPETTKAVKAMHKYCLNCTEEIRKAVDE
jgi:hypothetical protein